LLPGVVVIAVVAPRLGAVLLGGAVIMTGLWLLTRCRHPGRLGLLPPSLLPDGTRTQAQWYCDACGKTWPAAFKHEQTPIVKYAGFDQSKAPAAARRAADLERRRQAAAVRRAGIAAAAAQQREREIAATRPTIVAIEGRRVERPQPEEVTPPPHRRHEERPSRPASSA
jgi:hypothetical protein